MLCSNLALGDNCGPGQCGQISARGIVSHSPTRIGTGNGGSWLLFALYQLVVCPLLAILGLCNSHLYSCKRPFDSGRGVWSVGTGLLGNDECIVDCLPSHVSMHQWSGTGEYLATESNHVDGTCLSRQQWTSLWNHGLVRTCGGDTGRIRRCVLSGLEITLSNGGSLVHPHGSLRKETLTNYITYN